VGDVDSGDAEPLVQQRELGAHADPQLGVQVGQRLVHQEHPGLPDDGPAHGDPLALAAGQGAGAPVEQVLEAEHRGDLVDPASPLRGSDPPHPQAEAHVPAHGHPGVEGVALEHHGDVALLRQGRGDVAVADEHPALGRLLQPGDHPQHGGLAAPGRADEHHEFARLDLEVDVAHGLDAAAEPLPDALQPHAGGRRGDQFLLCHLNPLALLPSDRA
jgi:hypothetical protein